MCKKQQAPYSSVPARFLALKQLHVHAAHSFFQREETEALLLVDASNAFNSLNRQTALRNIQRLCPSLATALINTYRSPSELYVDGDVLLSSGRNDPG